MVNGLKYSAILCMTLLALASCQREDKKEERSIDQLMEESKGEFPNTVEKTKKFEQEVKRANTVIKQEAEKRVDEINQELKKKKK